MKGLLTNPPGKWIRAHWQIMVIATIGIATAFFRLGARGLWGDEVWQVWWTDPRLFIRLRAPTDLPMQFILVGLTTLFSKSEFFVRLPSALFGAGEVVVVFLLGRRMFNATTGWIAALLLAFAPYHVWYAQDARPYAALSFYSTLTLYFFYSMRIQPSRRNAIGFAAATILNLLNHFFALFPWTTELLFILLWTISKWMREPQTRVAVEAWRTHALGIRGRLELFRPTTPATQFLFPLAIVLASGLIPLLLFSPFVISAAYYALVQGYAFDPNTARLEITSSLVTDFFSLFGSGSGASFVLMRMWGLLGVAALLYYRRWLPLILSVTWLALPFGVLAILRPRFFLHPRFLLFLQPVYLLLVGWGLAQVPPLLRRAAQSLSSSVRLLQIVRIVSLLFALVMVADEIPLTWNGYWVERLNDWSAMCTYLHSHVQAGDVLVGEGYIEGELNWCYQKASGVSVLNANQYPLSDLVTRGQDFWYLSAGLSISNRSTLKQDAIEVPRAEWAPQGLLPPNFDNGGRLRYPQHESPVALFFSEGGVAPTQLNFRDMFFKPEWPTYTQVNRDDYRAFRLGLPSTQPRLLSIQYLDLPGMRLRLVINQTTLIQIDSTETGNWIMRQVALPSDSPDTFLLELWNDGSTVAAVSQIQVRYAPNP